MEPGNNNNDTLHTAAQWEESFSKVYWTHDITEMHFCRGKVTKVSGYIYMKEGMKRVSWNKQGLCFHRRNRMSEYDINFES